jgi:hypothetical protein
MTKNTKIPKVISNNKKKIEPVFIPENEQWNWKYFLVPELIAEISSLLTVRNAKRFQFFDDLKKFLKIWKKGTKEEMIEMYSERLNTLKINLSNEIDLIDDNSIKQYNREIVLTAEFLRNLKKL